jgi:hypothetical protein
MTKTALRALTVVALSAAVALTTAAPALADTEPVTPAPVSSTDTGAADAPVVCDPEAPYATEECPNPWPDTTNVTVCMTEPQLCEPDPAQAPVTPAPVQVAPQAAAPADPGTAPAELDGERPAGQPVSTGTITAPTAAAPTAVAFDWNAVWAKICGQLATLFQRLALG